MTFGQLISELAQNNIALTVTQNSIKTNVPVDQLPDDLREALRLNKFDIIAIMNKPLKEVNNLVDVAVSLGGFVVGEVELDDIPGEVVTVKENQLTFDDWLKGEGEIICPSDKFGF